MASKRAYELIEKLTDFAGFFFVTDKLGETEAKKVSFETLQDINKAYVNSEKLDAITVTSNLFNTTDLTVNALFTTDEVVFRLPYNCKILKIDIVLKSIDTGTVGTLNCKIKGQAGNVFNSDISLTTASAADGSGGTSSSNVNTLYNSGLKDTDLLFYVTAGTNADAGNGQIYLTVQRTS